MPAYAVYNPLIQFNSHWFEVSHLTVEAGNKFTVDNF